MTLAYLAAAWFLGAVAAALGLVPPWPLVAIAGVASAAVALAQRRIDVALVALLCAALFSGAVLRFDAGSPTDQPAGIARYNDGDAVQFRALVTGDPEEKTSSVSLHLQARQVLQDGVWQPVSGGVLLRQSLLPRYQYGDLLEIKGKLETPPVLPDFDYRSYLARQGVVSEVNYPKTTLIEHGRGNPLLAAVHGLRNDLSSALARALPEPQASLGQGILLGRRAALPQDLTDDLNGTSTSHIIALSGYNVTVLAALIMAATAWLIGRRRAAVLALAAIAAYTVFTGASPSLVRAAIMGALFLVATLLGRPNSGLISLVVAGAVMTGLNPTVVQDVSFQLSFAAAAGLICLTPLLQERTLQLLRLLSLPDPSRGGLADVLFETATITAAAVISTLPLMALHFQRLSLVALPANLLVVPAFPFIMVTSAAVAIAGLFSGPLATALGWVAWLGLTYMIEAVRLFAGVPFASIELRGFTMGHAVALYVLLGALTWLLSRRRPSERSLRRPWQAAGRVGAVLGRPLRAVPTPWLAGALAIPAVLTWTAVLSTPDSRLEVKAFDVGQGDAILIRTPDGHKLLIDGGPDGRAVTAALGAELPFWDRKLDMVLSTHPDDDHLMGLVTVLERYDVGQVVAGPTSLESSTEDAFRKLIADRAIPYHEATAGEWIDLGSGARLQIFGPPADPLTGTDADTNNNSLVLKLVWGKVSFLLTGDIESAGESALLQFGVDLHATVLKVAHHGSAYATSEALLQAVQPKVAVISVGQNDFGQPAQSTIDRLAGTILYRTDQEGAVTFFTDGDRLWVASDRGQPALP
ncbi:MAG: DNA internalization-related competence protein ComEC/Rec2 [Dehalococcoidia bacterium]